MKCPIDNTDLVMSERQGIEIDYCPTCRGVWLDRGELDKIIERASPEPQAVPQQQRYQEQRGGDYQDRYRDDDHQYRHKKKKREGFLGEIFDF
jgi:Zn-finger nucleic acid-binding protein